MSATPRLAAACSAAPGLIWPPAALGARVRHCRGSILVGWILLALLPGAMACSDTEIPEITVGEALEMLRSEDPPLFLDVRSAQEYEGGHIPGALHVAHTEIADRLADIRAEGKQEIVLFCERGGRARVAAGPLAQTREFKLHHMAGDMRAWRRAAFPVLRGAARHSEAAEGEDKHESE